MISPVHRLVGLILAVQVAIGVAAPARADDPPARPRVTPSTSFTIAGAVQTPLTLDLAGLQKRSATTATVYFGTGRGPVTRTYTGVPLWTLLNEAGIKTDPAIKNDRLRRSVVVTATDGYGVTLSLGELDPEFGAAQAVVAYAQDGKPLADGGFARLIMPADKDAGRNVARIAGIEVR
jgi:DMSO/TMAO reductase YedYZ molybdopterin-dependent catalytic subunit